MEDEPTTIVAALDGVTQTTANWTPTWPEPPPAQIRYEATSSTFTPLVPALPAEAPLSVTASVVSGRGTVAVTQLPSAANNFTLNVRFQDGFNGSADLRGLITVTTPEPAGAVLLLTGVTAGLLRRRRRPTPG